MKKKKKNEPNKYFNVDKKAYFWNKNRSLIEQLILGRCQQEETENSEYINAHQVTVVTCSSLGCIYKW